MEEKFVVVCWPESQMLMEHKRFDECFLINDEMGLDKFGSAAYCVSEELYNEIFNVKKKTKLIYIEVTERNGEREYTHRVVREVSKRVRNIQNWADKNIAGGMYGDKPKNVDGSWVYDDGEVICELYKAEEITKEQYDVLFRFL